MSWISQVYINVFKGGGLGFKKTARNCGTVWSSNSKVALPGFGKRRGQISECRETETDRKGLVLSREMQPGQHDPTECEWRNNTQRTHLASASVVHPNVQME